MKFGIIAEDDSDVAVVRQMTLKLLKPHKIGFKRFVGNGCGKLRRKCGAWARYLVQQGCPCLIVVHDLDTCDEAELRPKLMAAICPSGAEVSVVLIPKREIEAWLLYDGAALASAFNESKAPPLPADPEKLTDPKTYLRELVWKKYRKRYLHTLHNEKIAEHIQISLLKPSASFAPHFVFAAKVQTLFYSYRR
jgi:hypothetical protein